MKSFEQMLKFGNDGEHIIKEILISKGYGVIPSYAYTSAEKQSPRIEKENSFLVVPDLDCCRRGKRFWIECKRYTKSPYVWAYKENTHGIPGRLYEQYKMVEEETGNPVWLVVLEHNLEVPGENHSVNLIPTNKILSLRLSDYEPLPCLCKGCKCGEKCRNKDQHGIRGGVYFRRSWFDVIYSLKEEMAA